MWTWSAATRPPNPGPTATTGAATATRPMSTVVVTALPAIPAPLAATPGTVRRVAAIWAVASRSNASTACARAWKPTWTAGGPIAPAARTSGRVATIKIVAPGSARRVVAFRQPAEMGDPAKRRRESTAVGHAHPVPTRRVAPAPRIASVASARVVSARRLPARILSGTGLRPPWTAVVGVLAAKMVAAARPTRTASAGSATAPCPQTRESAHPPIVVMDFVTARRPTSTVVGTVHVVARGRLVPAPPTARAESVTTDRARSPAARTPFRTAQRLMSTAAASARRAT